MNQLLKRAIQLVKISDDMRLRHDGDPENFKIYDFDQTWTSTALGFGGIGGSKITTERTYVIISGTRAFIYFGNSFAYSIPVCDKLLEDIKNKRVASVSQISRYKENNENDGI